MTDNCSSGGMRDIPGYEGLYALTETGDVWSYRAERFLVQSQNRGGYAQVGLSDTYAHSKTAMVHRLMGLTYLGSLTGMDVDHIDGDKANNRLANLRACTRSQNLGNRRLNKNTTSGFKGVNYSKYHNKWRVRITVGRVEKFLGYFATAAEAGRAYDVAATREFGAFALTNGSA